MPLRNGIPSHDTFSRVFRLLDPEAFQEWFLGFMRQFAQGCEGVLAVDGKTLRRSYDRADPVAAAPGQRLGCRAKAVAGPTGRGRQVQRDNGSAQAPGNAGPAGDGGECHAPVRDNFQQVVRGLCAGPEGQPGDPQRRWRLFQDPATPLLQATQTNKGHGRIETRTASISDDVAWLQERHQWPGLAAVGKITASRQMGDRSSVENRYYLLSQAFTPERFNHIVRGHWGIENRLHWVLDVVFNEDQSREGPDNLALLRKLALNLARLEPKGSMPETPVGRTTTWSKS